MHFSKLLSTFALLLPLVVGVAIPAEKRDPGPAAQPRGELYAGNRVDVHVDKRSHDIAANSAPGEVYE
ncbi:hypothetical protein ABW19_dt0208399 [Dactylella cylindrospora]|nr:hypothetical protein ABW19_dt0208399 [Dactylella cylindrospora]